MNKITLNNQNGFTLIEVLIGITVFAIGILALTIMQVGAVKGNSSAGNLTEASTIGQDRLEVLLGLDYMDANLDDDDLDGTSQDSDGDGDDDDGGDFGLNEVPLPQPPPPAVPGNADGTDTYTSTTGVIYDIFWNIAVNDPPFTNTKTIRVFVIWNENGRLRTVTFDSLKNIGT